jgi:hypothetical protein
MLAAVAEAPPSASPAAVHGGLVQQAVAGAAAGLEAAAAVAQEAATEEEMEGEEAMGQTAQLEAKALSWPLLPTDCSQQRAASLQLAALSAVFSDTRQAKALTPQNVEAAVGSILRLLIAPNATASISPQQTAAVATLAAVAGSAHADVLSQAALPQLVAAAGQQATAATALAALQALAAASNSLQLDVVVALDQAIQQQLPAAAGAAGAAAAPANGATLLLHQLLQAATGIVSSAPVQATPTDAPKPPCFLQLAQHVFGAVQLLPALAEAAGFNAGGSMHCGFYLSSLSIGLMLLY